MAIKRLKLRPLCRWLVAAIVAAVIATPGVVCAQVVVVANGSPITELDIQQRTKLIITSAHKPPTRQEVINELIDDRVYCQTVACAGRIYLSETDTDPLVHGDYFPGSWLHAGAGIRVIDPEFCFLAAPSSTAASWPHT